MKKEKICLNLNKKKLCLNVFHYNFIEMARGLMFLKKEKAPIIFYESKKPKLDAIHSWFVFFDFLAVWIDEKNNVLEVRKIKPFKLHANYNGNWKKLIEIPIATRYDSEIKFLVGNSKGLNR